MIVNIRSSESKEREDLYKYLIFIAFQPNRGLSSSVFELFYYPFFFLFQIDDSVKK